MRLRTFRDVSIKRKLTLIMMLMSSVALLLAGTAFGTYELIMFRRAMTSHLLTLAEIVGANSTAALAFNDQSAARETLAALSAEPHIVSATIYARDGRAFAHYFRADRSQNLAPPTPQEDGHHCGPDYLVLFRRIVLDGERIGTVYIQSDLQEMQARLQLYAGIVVTVLLASSCVAFVLSSKLRGVISEPIMHLAQTARVVSVEKNDAIRAVKQSQDELGLLIDGFNEMLHQIQERDAALQKARDELEKRVEERTWELQQEISERQ